MLDVNKVRKQFPIFSNSQTSANQLIYFDNAATTQRPMVVLERLQRFYSQENANIHRGIYQLAYEATQEYELAREKVASFINARVTEEVVFCRGTTEAINMVAQGWGREQLGPNDEVLVTVMEHHSNYVPWAVVCKQTGAKFRVTPVTEDGRLDLGQLKKMINANTRVLAITHISNTLGTINPLQEIIALAHEKQVVVVVDAAQSIAFDQLDVQHLDCDFLGFSGHKAFGPMGIGVLYGKKEYLSRLHPFQQGGSMITQVSQEDIQFKPPPHGLEAGTPPVAEAIALGTALDFITEIGLGQIKEHSQSTLLYAREQLSSIQGIQIIGPATRTSNIISFLLDDIHPHDIATILGTAGIAVRAGHHCTQPLMASLGINSTVRASFSIYNNHHEVDQLVSALGTVKKIMS